MTQAIRERRSHVGVAHRCFAGESLTNANSLRKYASRENSVVRHGSTNAQPSALEYCSLVDAFFYSISLLSTHLTLSLSLSLPFSFLLFSCYSFSHNALRDCACRRRYSCVFADRIKKKFCLVPRNSENCYDCCCVKFYTKRSFSTSAGYRRISTADLSRHTKYAYQK